MSRFVVSFALHLQQAASFVIEALEGRDRALREAARSAPDQGRQLLWRGRSESKLLKREGIQHVVARSHHPQTVGKCERLWETIQVEFLARVTLTDLSDARVRLAHYFRHYNFFRPHQGIDGLVPADRFFGAQDALRETLEKQLTRQELAQALQEPPLAPVFPRPDRRGEGRAARRARAPGDPDRGGHAARDVARRSRRERAAARAVAAVRPAARGGPTHTLRRPRTCRPRIAHPSRPRR